jgi:hypothetical protein
MSAFTSKSELRQNLKDKFDFLLETANLHEDVDIPDDLREEIVSACLCTVDEYNRNKRALQEEAGRAASDVNTLVSRTMNVVICNDCKAYWIGPVEKCECGCKTLTKTHKSNAQHALNLE